MCVSTWRLHHDGITPKHRTTLLPQERVCSREKERARHQASMHAGENSATTNLGVISSAAAQLMSPSRRVRDSDVRFVGCYCTFFFGRRA